MKIGSHPMLFGLLMGGIAGGLGLYLLRASEKDRKRLFARLAKLAAELEGHLGEPISGDEAAEELLRILPEEGLKAAAIAIKLWKTRGKAYVQKPSGKTIHARGHDRKHHRGALNRHAHHKKRAQAPKSRHAQAA